MCEYDLSRSIYCQNHSWNRSFISWCVILAQWSRNTAEGTHEHENQVELCGTKLFKNYADFWINSQIWPSKMNNLERIIFRLVSYITRIFSYFIKDKYALIKLDNKFVSFSFTALEQELDQCLLNNDDVTEDVIVVNRNITDLLSNLGDSTMADYADLSSTQDKTLSEPQTSYMQKLKTEFIPEKVWTIFKNKNRHHIDASTDNIDLKIIWCITTSILNL